MSEGQAPYTFQWDNGMTGPTITHLNAGFYTATVTDALGQVATVTIEVPLSEDCPNEPEDSEAQVAINANVSHITCYGLCNGTVTLEINGPGNYQVNWLNSGNTGLTEPGLCEGSHQYYITDSQDPTVQIFQQVTIDEPDVLVAFFDQTGVPSIPGACNGSATLEIVGGTPPYTIHGLSDEWVISENELSLANLCSGQLVFPVTDANGCSTAASAHLDEPEVIVLTSSSVSACSNDNEGEASVIAVDGEPPYTFQWDNGMTGSTITGLSAGLYTATVTDALGQVATVTVEVPLSDDCPEEPSNSTGSSGGFAGFNFTPNIIILYNYSEIWLVRKKGANSQFGEPYKIYSSNGALVQTGTAEGQRSILNTADLEVGVYLLQTENEVVRFAVPAN